MPGVHVPKLARVLLAAMAVAFAAVLAQDAFGIVPPVWPAAWQKAYNASEFLAAAACAVRAARTTGPERAAWMAFTVGLVAYFAGDVYSTSPPSRRPPTPATSASTRPRTSASCCSCAPARGGSHRRCGSTA